MREERSFLVFNMLLCRWPLVSSIHVPAEWENALRKMCIKAENGEFPHPSPQAQIVYGYSGQSHPEVYIYYIRTTPIPSAAVLRQQLLSFKAKWEEISFSGQAIISPTVTKEIHCLLVHIDKGCLSGIQPGRGTTRNERLHRDLNAHMSSSIGMVLNWLMLF